MKPRGSMWSRKRRRNSSLLNVIFRFLFAVDVVLPPECDLIIIKFQQSVIRGGDPVRVARQVVKRVLRSARTLCSGISYRKIESRRRITCTIRRLGSNQHRLRNSKRRTVHPSKYDRRSSPWKDTGAASGNRIRDYNRCRIRNRR
jgi:hypothetical protein